MAQTATTHLWTKQDGEFPAALDPELVETLMTAKRNHEARVTIVWALNENAARDDDWFSEPVVEVTDTQIKTKVGDSASKSIWTLPELLKFGAAIRFAYL